MTPQQHTHLADLLETNAGVDAGYRHIAKRVTPAAPLERSGALLKWYDVHPEDRPVPDEIAQLAREHLTTEPSGAKGLGFVVLHRCGADFYFLIVCTWRNSNEIWQTVFYKDGDAMAEFRLFPRDEPHKPTFCVWELVPMWHEQRAWVRFLSSPRNTAAADEWLGDRFAGPA